MYCSGLVAAEGSKPAANVDRGALEPAYIRNASLTFSNGLDKRSLIGFPRYDKNWFGKRLRKEGKEGLRKLVLGSGEGEVIKWNPCPVTVVK